MMDMDECYRMSEAADVFYALMLQELLQAPLTTEQESLIRSEISDGQ